MISDDFEVAANGNIRRTNQDAEYTVLDLHMYVVYLSDLKSWRERKTPRRAWRVLTSWWGYKHRNRLPRLRKLLRYGVYR